MLKILGGLAALAFGLWLGRPGRYERPQIEVDQALDRSGPRQYTKRVFTPLDLLKKTAKSSARSGFSLKDPDAKPDPEDRTVSIRASRLFR